MTPPPPAVVCVPLLSALLPFVHDRHADTLDQLSPIEAARAVAWVNAQPPPTEFEYRTVVIVRLMDRRAIVMMGDGGEICRAVLVAAELAPDLMRAVNGDRS
jgi:hypothetical protein